MKNALAAIDAMIDPARPYLLLERITQADIAAVVAERLARAQTPHLRALTQRLGENPFFNVAEP